MQNQAVMAWFWVCHVKQHWGMLWRHGVVVVWLSGWKHEAQGGGLGQKPKTTCSDISTFLASSVCVCNYLQLCRDDGLKFQFIITKTVLLEVMQWQLHPGALV